MIPWLNSKTCFRGTSVSDTLQRCRRTAWAPGSPVATKTRKSTRATFVSTMAARWRNAKHRTEFLSSLQRYDFPVFGSVPVAEVSEQPDAKRARAGYDQARGKRRFYY